MELEDLSYCYCCSCENSFFIQELPMGINDPNFCPYCGVKFNELTEVEDVEDV